MRGIPVVSSLRTRAYLRTPLQGYPQKIIPPIDKWQRITWIGFYPKKNDKRLMPFVLETKLMNISILCAQDAYLELYPQSKIPADTKWSDQGKPLEEALSNEGNLGLLLGPKSDIMDVDLDCLEAKALADLILPKALAQFDRGTADSGHYLYRATSFGPTKKFNANGPKSTLVELRGDGAQTMIPPSIHPNGESSNFTEFNPDALEFEYSELLKAVSFLGA